MSDGMNRRQAIGVMGAAALGSGLVTGRALGDPQGESRPRRRVLRIAHLTDVHVQPERRANQGMIACLRHVQSESQPPDLILTGGDSIMDSFEADAARTKVQWDLWGGILKDECSIPVRSCIGNHDIWGWAKGKSRCTGTEPSYGKKMATEMLRLDGRYYSFDYPEPAAGAGRGAVNGAWHFVVLDSTQTDGGEGYKAFLDDEQFDWLQRDLAAVRPGTPIAVLSHIPIMSAVSTMYAKKNERGDHEVKGSLVHTDARKIKDLFARTPGAGAGAGVKLCLAGHLHHLERIDHNGVTYLCNGAVSGNWWKGRHQDCDEGYAMIDLFEDGSIESSYHTYGWKAEV